MKILSEKIFYEESISPIVNPSAVIQGDTYRFSVLTSGLIRMEYSKTGEFEDKATQTVVNRKFDVPEYTVFEKDGNINIKTERVLITYNGREFSRYNLKARYIGKNSSVFAGPYSTFWRFGDKPRFNLKGTTKTLDNIDGECELESGIMSRGEICVLDDSKTMALTDDGWFTSRDSDAVDIYLFCYGDSEKRYDYKECLKDYFTLTGKTPLIPRYALGNWWSRYYPYTQQEYTNLMKRFKNENIPFSVAVIDMDWHITKIDSKYGTGWTGYTWNEELFPNRKSFLNFLHCEGMEVTLNLHPQQGIAAHEKQYKNMAKAMSVDPETEETIPFDFTNREFVNSYFKILHHPLEEEGVSFWWIDWQQGNTTDVEGLDPLWLLNHFHYTDSKREGKRGLIFSRYSGAGSHRYPLGFSGDSYATWKSLEFQPYFTQTASNIGYCWWSHDIGGHQGGNCDSELQTRWVQLGVFSPINRLHSGYDIFFGKEPWKFDKISELSMKKFLKLRHSLIPYLYSMNYRLHTKGEPIVQPLYYNWADEKAYRHGTEYSFGSQMIVSPIVKPNSDELDMGEADVFLPEGTWFDFFDNTVYHGGRELAVYRDIYNMPVFVKAGGIIPLAKLEKVNNTDNPKNLKIKVFMGADNIFEMYEDDGRTYAYKNGCYSITEMELKWGEKTYFKIHKPIGDEKTVVNNRNYEIELIGVEDNRDFKVLCGGQQIAAEVSYKNNSIVVEVNNVSSELAIVFNSKPKVVKNNFFDRVINILKRAKTAVETKDSIYKILLRTNDISEILADINYLDISRDIRLAVSEAVTADNYKK